MSAPQFGDPVTYQGPDGVETKTSFSFAGDPGFDVDDGDWQNNLKAQPNRRRFPNSPELNTFRTSGRYGRNCWVRNSRGFVYKIK